MHRLCSHWRLPSFEQRFPHRVMPTGTLIPSATKITMSPFLPQSRCVARWTPSEQVEKDRMPPAGPRCWGSGGTGTGSTRQLSVWRRRMPSSPTGKARTLRTQTSRAGCLAQSVGLLGCSVEAPGASEWRSGLFGIGTSQVPGHQGPECSVLWKRLELACSGGLGMNPLARRPTPSTVCSSSRIGPSA